MKTNTIIGLGALALIAYYVFRKKPVLNVEKAPATPPASATPVAPPANVPSLTPSPAVKLVKGIDDGIITDEKRILAEEEAKMRLARKKARIIMPEDIKVPSVEPIMISPINLIPDVYDRGVGKQPRMNIPASGESYYNMSGVCTENIQNTCKCASQKRNRYKTDIPQLP